MSDSIKMSIKAEVDPSSINNIKQEIENLTKNMKPLKIKAESKDVMNLTKDMEKMKSTISRMNKTKIRPIDSTELKKSGLEFVKVTETAEKSMKQIEEQYKKLGQVSIQGQNWDAATKELNQFTVKLKEADGVVRKYKYTLSELENGQKVWVNNSIKGSEKIAEIEARNAQKISKSLWDVSKEKLNSIGKESEEIKKLNSYYRELESTGNKLHSQALRENKAFDNKQVRDAKDLLKAKRDLLTIEKDLDNLQSKTGKLDNSSAEYKQITKEVTNLRDVHKELSKEINKLETVDLDKAKGEINELKTEVQGTKTYTNKMIKQQDEAKKAIKEQAVDVDKLAGGMQSTGRSLMAFSAPILAVGTAAVKKNIEFESSFAGVRKTLGNASKEEVAGLEKGFRNLAKLLPQTASEVAAVGQVAGQLGVPTEHIVEFSKVMIMLGDTAANLSASEAADSLARFANITQMSYGDFDRLASVVLDLGNNLATSEKEIIAMGTRLAGAGHQVGLTEAQIMAFAGALSSAGIKIEAGGTAFSKLMINMQLAAEKGEAAHGIIAKTGMSLRELEMLADADGKSFKGLAQNLGLTSKELKEYMKAAKTLNAVSKITGKSASEFAKSFKEDAAGAILDFINGLAKAEKEGKSVIKILDDMGIREVRLRDAILRAVGANDIFNDSLKRGSKAWDENTALMEAAEQRYDTAEVKLKRVRDQIIDIGIEIGRNLTPSVLSMAEVVVALAKGFSKLPIAIQGGIFKIFALTTAVGGLLSIGGRFLRGLNDTGRFFGELSKMFGGTIKMTDAAGESVSGLSMLFQALTSKAGLMTAGVITAIALGAKAINKHVEETKKKKKEMDKLAEDMPKIKKRDKNDIKYMQDIQAEFEYLNSLVGENGDLSAMSSDQQKRYLDIVKKLKEMFPELETFYNSQGQLVADTTTKIEELIKAKKEEMRIDAEKTHAGFEDRLKEHSKAVEEATKKEEKLLEQRKKNKDELEHGKYVTDPFGKKKWQPLNEKQKEEALQSIREIDAKLAKTNAVAREEASKTMKHINAEMFLISDSFEILTPHVEHFKSAFKEMMEEDPSEKGLKNVKTAVLELGNISEELQGKVDAGQQIKDEEITKYIKKLTDLNMSQEMASQGMFGIVTSINNGEEAFNAINKAVSEFNKNGKISPETAAMLGNNFDEVSDKVEKVDLALLRNIAAKDKWAAAFMASQMEIDNSITSFVNKNNEQLKNLKPIEVVEPDKIVEQVGIAQQARTEMINQINQDAEDQKAIISYLYDELGVISKEQADKEIEDIERVKQKRLEDAEFAFNEQSRHIVEKGEQIREGLEQAIMEAEQGTMSIEQIWNNLDPETKEFIIKTTGLKEADEDFHSLLEDWLINDPEPKDFIVTCEGLEYILDNIDELGEDWDKLKPEEKIFVAKMLGYGLKDAEDFQEKWDKLDPKVKKFIAEAAGYEDVNKADEETMKKWADDPKIRMFIASHGGLDNVRIEQDKTDGQWKIKIGDRVYTSDEDGAKEARDEFNETKDDWDKIPNKSVKQFIIDKITNLKTRIFGSKEENWTGNKDFKGGLTYVGERGRELLIYPDNSYDITGNTTELRNLPRGTRIYNNRDTEDILSGKKIPKFAKGNTKARNKKDDYKAEYDRYTRFEIDLAKIDALLQRNKTFQEMANKNLTKRIQLLKKEEQLSRQKQKILNQNNNERRKEMKQLERKLSSKGFKFSGVGDNRVITNLSHIQGKAKEIEEDFNRYNEIQSKLLPEASQEWWNLQKSIEEVTLDKMIAQFELADNRVQRLKDSFEQLNFEASMLDDDDFIGKKENITNKIANLETQVQEATWALKSMGENGYKEGSKLAEEYKQRQKELIQRIKEGTLAIKEQEKALIDLRESMRQDWISDQNKLHNEQRNRIQSLEKIQSIVISIIRKRGEIEKKELNESHKAEMKSLEERHKERKEKYKEDLDLFRDTIQAKIDALDEQYNEEDYLEELNKKREEARKIQDEIDLLSLDTSLTAKNRVIELREQLAQKNEDIAKLQQRKERELTKKTLQDQLKDKENEAKEKEKIADDTYENEKKRLEEDYRINSEFLEKKYSDEKIYAEAREALLLGQVEVSKGVFEDIYIAYLDFEKKFGQGMGILGDIIEADFLDKLKEAQEAIENLDYLLQNQLPNYDSDYDPGDNVIGWEDTVDKVKNRPDEFMNWSDEDYEKYIQNKQNWEDASLEEKKRLNEENNKLREQYWGKDNKDDFYHWSDLEDWGRRPEFKNWSDEDYERYISNKQEWENSTPAQRAKLAQENAELRKKYWGETEDKLHWTDITNYNRPPEFRKWSDKDYQEYIDNKRKWETTTQQYGKGGRDELMAKNALLREKYWGINSAFKDKYHWKELVNWKGFANGGKITETGTLIAPFHGSKINPEWIFNDTQLKKILKDTVSSTIRATKPKVPNMTPRQSVELKVDNLINVEGNMTEDVIPKVKTAGKSVLDDLRNVLDSKGIYKPVR